MIETPDRLSRLLADPLRYFAEVAEQGSFSAAAKSLHISQPSLSVAVKKLEEELGATLLHRNARGVSLTTAGELLLSRTRQAGSALVAAQEEIDTLTTEPRGSFTLGCHESLASYFLPGFMGKFLGRYPDIRLSLRNANSREVEQAVDQREVELGLVVNPSSLPDSVVVPLFEDRVTFVVAKKLVRGRAGADDRIRDSAVFLVPALMQTQSILSELAERDVRPKHVVECSSMELVKSLVLDGAGLGILPYRVAMHGVAAGRLRLLGGTMPVYRDRIALVRRADSPMTVAFRILLDAITAHGKAMKALPKALH